MEKIRCIVLDDDLAYCELISSYIEEHARLELVGKFTEPGKAKKFLSRNQVPLIFIDMKMPEITGIDFLHSIGYCPYSIILTSYPDFAMDGYRVKALDYILKPFAEERFFAAVNRALVRIDSKTKVVESTSGNEVKTGDGFFFIHNKQQYVKLQFKDILYIEALQNFVKIVSLDKTEPVITNSNLKQLENTLPAESFIRTHKSYIVNINHVSIIEKDTSKIADIRIPIGPSFKEVIMKKLMKDTIRKR